MNEKDVRAMYRWAQTDAPQYFKLDLLEGCLKWIEKGRVLTAAQTKALENTRVSFNIELSRYYDDGAYRPDYLRKVIASAEADLLRLRQEVKRTKRALRQAVSELAELDH